MKICDITQFYNSSSGGIRTYIDMKRKYIKEETDWEHLLIIPGEEDSIYCQPKASTLQIAAPLVPAGTHYRFIVRLDKVISILKVERPDIIELGCPYILPWAAFFYRGRFHCAVIGCYHTDFPTAYVEPIIAKIMGNDWAQKAKHLASLYLRLVYNKCDMTFTSSKIFQKKLSQLGVYKVEYIPFGVDLSLFNPKKKDKKIRQKFGVGDKDLLLIYAGRFDAEKRLDVVIEAFKKLPKRLKAILVLVGEGPLKKYLDSKTTTNPRMFVMTYHQDREKLARLLASADIYVTAGPFETFGLSVIEAQASGLPVVGVRAGALIERVIPGVGVLGRVDSAEDMAQNIVFLYQNGLMEKGIKARKLVESNFSWEKTFKQLFRLYRNLYLKKGQGFN